MAKTPETVEGISSVDRESIKPGEIGIDAPTLTRLRSERNSRQPGLTGGQRIPRAIAPGFPGHMGIRP